MHGKQRETPPCSGVAMSVAPSRSPPPCRTLCRGVPFLKTSEEEAPRKEEEEERPLRGEEGGGDRIGTRHENQGRTRKKRRDRKKVPKQWLLRLLLLRLRPPLPQSHSISQGLPRPFPPRLQKLDGGSRGMQTVFSDRGTDRRGVHFKEAKRCDRDERCITLWVR